jgi:hypothetical protein
VCFQSAEPAAAAAASLALVERLLDTLTDSSESNAAAGDGALDVAAAAAATSAEWREAEAEGRPGILVRAAHPTASPCNVRSAAHPREASLGG